MEFQALVQQYRSGQRRTAVERCPFGAEGQEAAVATRAAWSAEMPSKVPHQQVLHQHLVAGPGKGI